LKVLSVSELTRYVKNLLRLDDLLGEVSVEGEISNFKRHTSGHLYFSLKDSGAVLRCVMFRSAAQRLGNMPSDGMQALCTGRIDVYEAAGQYQLYVDTLRPSGIGELFRKFEETKRKLETEGLFADELKRPLPFLPKRIGVATSGTGAAIRDILRVLSEKAPYARVFVAPCQVQGADAPADIARALDLLIRAKVEVIILGRGGGSFEDLFCFSDETLARRIAECPVPTISAVGHETDFSISDFVADFRAATPTQAAETAIQDVSDLVHTLTVLRGRCLSAARAFLAERSVALKGLRERTAYRDPTRFLNENREKIDRQFASVLNAVRGGLALRREKIEGALRRLTGLSPERVMERGFAFISDSEGKPVTSVEHLSVDDEMVARMIDGTIESRIFRIRRKEEV
jgi:exodeoxyribonuclease VII large subunit